jgi:hypothetical protein
MLVRNARLLALVLVAVAGCGGKSPEGKGKPVPVTKQGGAPKPIAKRGDDATAPEPAPAGAPADAPPPTEPAAEAGGDPLGQRFMDPGWFRKDMIEGAKALDVSRSQKNEQGLFSSQILFELPAGTTAEQCADRVTDKVKGDVPNLERTTEGDRIKISGTTDRYRVTMMCGEAKGVMRAYVSFEWTG